MFRPMRRHKQALSRPQCDEILSRATSGVLAVAGDDDYPYAVPISFFYDGTHLYFHCAKEGHKLDAIARNPKASFCVIDQDVVVPETYTTHFRSVIVFGQVHVMEDDAAKWAAIEKLALKYAPEDSAERRKAAIEAERSPLCMLEMTLEHVSGKEAIELIRQREGK